MYDINQGVIAYSTDPILIGKKVRESLGYKKAVMGQNSSRLVSGGGEYPGNRPNGGREKTQDLHPLHGSRAFSGGYRACVGGFLN